MFCIVIVLKIEDWRGLIYGLSYIWVNMVGSYVFIFT